MSIFFYGAHDMYIITLGHYDKYSAHVLIDELQIDACVCCTFTATSNPL